MSEPIPSSARGVYRLILEMLWNMEWVPSKEILERTGQAEYARRIRELRGEFGYPIAQLIMGGTPHYRLESRAPSFRTRRRKYFTERQKKDISARDGEKCNICTRNGDAVQLMWDHRVPFEYGGETDSANGQMLCVTCNNIKRKACGSCANESCDKCLFARPELGRGLVIVDLDETMRARLAEISVELGMTPVEVASKFIRDALRDRRS